MQALLLHGRTERSTAGQSTEQGKVLLDHRQFHSTGRLRKHRQPAAPPQQWLMVSAPVEIDDQQVNEKIIRGKGDLNCVEPLTCTAALVLVLAWVAIVRG